MPIHQRLLLIWCAVLLLCSLLARRGFAKVYISEVMWTGSDLSASDEWVEVACEEESDETEESDPTSLEELRGAGGKSGTEECPADLSGWTLTSVNSSGVETPMITFPSGTNIQEGEHVLVSNFSAEGSRLLAPPRFVTTDVSLPNTKLLLRLRDADGTIVDLADDGTGNPFAGSNASDLRTSMERVRTDLPGSDLAAWASAQLSCGFDDGAALLGTPGFSPSCEIFFSSDSSDSSVSSDSPALSFVEVSVSSSSSISPLSISEILPNPPGTDSLEWVELQNLSTEAMDLSSCEILIGESDRSLPLAGTVSSQGFAFFHGGEFSFSLRNAGDRVSLFCEGTLIDVISYPELSEGMSFGRVEGNERTFCTSTKGAKNTLGTLIVRLENETLEGKASVNVRTSVLTGNAKGLQCLIDFGDGESADSCNPPSHSFDASGTYLLLLRATDTCGNNSDDSLEVRIANPRNSKREGSSTRSKTSGTFRASDAPIIISAVFPNPEGPDGTLEWVEIENRTDTGIVMDGWSLELSDHPEKSFTFRGILLGPRERRRFSFSETRMQLPNFQGELRLRSSDGSIASVLIWEESEEGRAITADPNLPLHAYIEKVLRADRYLVRLTRKAEFMYLPRFLQRQLLQNGPFLTVRLPGVISLPLHDIEDMNFIRALLEKKEIELKIYSFEDSQLKDVAAQMTLSSGLTLSEDLLRRGFITIDDQSSFVMHDEYRVHEKEAKLSLAGHWRDASHVLVALQHEGDVTQLTQSSSSSTHAISLKPLSVATVIKPKTSTKKKSSKSGPAFTRVSSGLLITDSYSMLNTDPSSGNINFLSVIIIACISLGGGYFLKLRNSP